MDTTQTLPPGPSGRVGTVVVDEGCSPPHVFCPSGCWSPGMTCCGASQCSSAQHCADAASGLCCSPGEEACNGKCVKSGAKCCPKGQKECNGKCIDQAAKCCPANQINCYGTCYPDTYTCCKNVQYACPPYSKPLWMRYTYCPSRPLNPTRSLGIFMDRNHPCCIPHIGHRPEFRNLV